MPKTVPMPPAAKGHQTLSAYITSRFDDPAVGVAWPEGLELRYSERDHEAPRLAEIADELPFEYRG